MRELLSGTSNAAVFNVLSEGCEEGHRVVVQFPLGFDEDSATKIITNLQHSADGDDTGELYAEGRNARRWKT